MPDTDSAVARFALIGHPVAHSRSPLIHQLFARQLGDRLTYELIDAAPENFEPSVRDFIAAGGRGMNVTVPHKEAAFALASAHGEEARAAGAVNTLSFADDSIRGDNTDGIGFLRDVTVNYVEPIENRRILVLGAGGAARGILVPLIAARPALLVLANRTVARAEYLAQTLSAGAGLTVRSFDDLADFEAFDIVVNATSAGLHGEQPPFPANVVGDTSFCYDLAYSLKPTPFVTWAASHGADRAVQGWGMLIEQAAESYAIWHGRRPDTGPILKQLTDAG